MPKTETAKSTISICVPSKPRTPPKLRVLRPLSLDLNEPTPRKSTRARKTTTHLSPDPKAKFYGTITKEKLVKKTRKPKTTVFYWSSTCSDSDDDNKVSEDPRAVRYEPRFPDRNHYTVRVLDHRSKPSGSDSYEITVRTDVGWEHYPYHQSSYKCYYCEDWVKIEKAAILYLPGNEHSVLVCPGCRQFFADVYKTFWTPLYVPKK